MKVLIMTDVFGRVTAVHVDDMCIEILCVREGVHQPAKTQPELKQIKRIPGGGEGWFSTWCGFDSLLRERFINSVFKKFGR